MNDTKTRLGQTWQLRSKTDVRNKIFSVHACGMCSECPHQHCKNVIFNISVIQRQTAVRRRIATQRLWTTPPGLAVMKIVRGMSWGGRDLKWWEIHNVARSVQVKATEELLVRWRTSYFNGVGLIRVGGINRENRVYMVIHLTQTQQRERHKRGNSYLV